jgi:predicted small secreted protein
MTKAAIIVFLGVLALAAGCSRTVKGAEKDVHSDVEWVGHKF